MTRREYNHWKVAAGHHTRDLGNHPAGDVLPGAGEYWVFADTQYDPMTFLVYWGDDDECLGEFPHPSDAIACCKNLAI